MLHFKLYFIRIFLNAVAIHTLTSYYISVISSPVFQRECAVSFGFLLNGAPLCQCKLTITFIFYKKMYLYTPIFIRSKANINKYKSGSLYTDPTWPNTWNY